MSFFSRIFKRTPIPLPFVTRNGGIDLGNNPIQDAILNEFNKIGKEINMQTCSNVAEFISSLNKNSNDVSGSLQKICEYILTIDFDAECGAMSLDIKDETFYWFEFLLKKYKMSKNSKSLDTYLKTILERFTTYDMLRKQGLLPDKLKSGFFERSGGETTANENMYDLIMYKKKQTAYSEKKKIEDDLFTSFGGRKTNKRSCNKCSSKKSSCKK